jgi:hypothetical protein
LTLLRERTWWIPGWLDKALPNITIEPPAERDESGARSPQPEPADAAARL